ncbi:MAG: hypothetical protein Q9226_002189 [Calogaya cf. arnoldii]
MRHQGRQLSQHGPHQPRSVNQSPSLLDPSWGRGHDHGYNNGESGDEAQSGEMQDDEDDTMKIKGDGWTAAGILEWMQIEVKATFDQTTQMSSPSNNLSNSEPALHLRQNHTPQETSVDQMESDISVQSESTKTSSTPSTSPEDLKGSSSEDNGEDDVKD